MSRRTLDFLDLSIVSGVSGACSGKWRSESSVAIVRHSVLKSARVPHAASGTLSRSAKPLASPPHLTDPPWVRAHSTRTPSPRHSAYAFPPSLRASRSSHSTSPHLPPSARAPHPQCPASGRSYPLRTQSNLTLFRGSGGAARLTSTSGSQLNVQEEPRKTSTSTCTTSAHFPLLQSVRRTTRA